jgi:hypothetical protein
MNESDSSPAVGTIDEPIEFLTASRLADAITVHWSDEDDAADVDDAGLPRIGDYLLNRRLGGGGSGTVYHAVLPGWNDEFAIKYLHVPVGEGRASRRLRRELDIVEQLELPSTPRVFEYGVQDGRMYIVSEHVDGVPLDAFCDDKGLGRRQRVRLLVRVARAVHALHECGVLHRDLKPSNILVRPDGSPVVIDLGIATLIGDDPAETITADGAPIGSVAYMAPEQARGEKTAGTIRADVYGLGATACRVLTGATPHDVEDLPVLPALAEVGGEPGRAPRDLDPTLPAPLAAIVGRALDDDPLRRFSSASDMADDLERWLDRRPVQSQPPSWWRNGWLSARRHPGRWAWGTVTGGLVAGLVVMTAVSRVNAAEAAAADAWTERYNEVIRRASERFVGRLADGRFSDALVMMKTLEDHAEEGDEVFESGEAYLAAAREHRDELTVRVLEAIHHANAGTGPAGDRVAVALAAIRSIYEHDDLGDEALFTQLEAVLRAYDTAD